MSLRVFEDVRSMVRAAPVLFVLMVAALLLPGPVGALHGAGQEDGGSLEASTILTAIRINETIRVDGVADEPAWAEAPALVVMVQD
ncbi:MAG: hypothetical protein D6733_05075, partial [Methanobacteriota archaeon]